VLEWLWLLRFGSFHSLRHGYLCSSRRIYRREILQIHLRHLRDRFLFLEDSGSRSQFVVFRRIQPYSSLATPSNDRKFQTTQIDVTSDEAMKLVPSSLMVPVYVHESYYFSRPILFSAINFSGEAPAVPMRESSD
jgi:hypothetical protein